MKRKKEGRNEWLEFEQLSGVVQGSSLRSGGLRAALKVPRYVTAGQCHSARVALVGEASHIDGCDALITNQVGVGLVIRHADCQAAIFYDPVHRAIANAHCGWRGNVQNIYKAVVEGMGAAFGSRPEDLFVSISPSLGPDGAEFINYKTELPEAFYRFFVKPLYIDLWAVSRWQLTDLGIPEAHIEIARLCTWSNSNDFYSYRRDKTSRRHETIAAIF